MNKIKYIILGLLLLPTITFAAIATGWNTPTISTGYVQPTYINGVQPAVQASSFTATSTTATSTFAGVINVNQTNSTSTFAGNLLVDSGTLVVDSQNNKVGVNTSSPSATLDVHGQTSDNTAFAFQAANSGGTSILTVRNDGNVGIGTTSPYRALSVYGSSDLGTNALAGTFTATSTTGTSTFANSIIVGTSTITAASNLDVYGTYGTNGSDLLTIENNRSQAGNLYFNNNIASARLYHTLDSTYLASTSDITIFSRVMVPTSAGTYGNGVSALSSSNSNGFSANAFVIEATSTALQVRLYGATQADYIQKSVANFFSTYANKIVDITVVRDATTPTLLIYINGILQTTTETTAGTAPTWAAIVNSTYNVVGLGSSASSIWNNRIYKNVVFNRDLSQTEIRQLRERDISWKDQWGSFFPLSNSSWYGGSTILNGDLESYSGGHYTSWGTSTSGTSIVTDETVDVYSGGHAVRYDMGTGYAYIAAPTGLVSTGKRYKVTVWAKTTDAGRQVKIGARTGSSGYTTFTLTSSWAQYSGEFTAASIYFALESVTTGTYSMYFDDIRIEEVGAVLDSNLENANPVQSTVVMDRSSNGYNGVVTATGVTQIKPPTQIGNLFFASSTGNIGVGTTSPATALDVNGTITQLTVKSCTLGLTTTALGSITGCVASDEKLKKNISEVLVGNAILKLKPVFYEWKDLTRDTQVHSGFVAQDVEKVIPSAVVSAGTNLKGVDSNSILAYVVKFIQGFYANFQKLAAKVSGLENRINDQQKQIDRLQLQVNQLLK